MWRFFMSAAGRAILRLAGTVGLLLILTATHIRGQSIEKLRGTVVDSMTGAPVAEAVVSVRATSYRNQTDGDGRFGFPYLPSGTYSLVTRAPGYAEAVTSSIVVAEDVSTNITVRLQPVVHLVDSIVVTGSRRNEAWDNSTVLTRKAIEERRPRDLADLLASVEGVQVTRSGGANGAALVSIRGSSPEHVLILIDGARANSAGNGVIDLNTIPIEMVERVEIHRGGESARYGPDALAGVINIVTQPESAPVALSGRTSSETGRWGNRRLGAELSDVAPMKGLISRLGVVSERSEGDFTYNYRVQPSNKVYSGTRRNNAVQSQNYFLSARYDYSPRGQVSFSSQYYRNSGGLPGPASAPTPDARKADDRRMFNGLWRAELSPCFSLETRGSVSRYVQTFVDTTNSSPLNRFNTKYVSDAYSLESGLYGDVGSTRGQVGLQIQRDNFDQSDFIRPTYSMGPSQRDIVGAYATVSQQMDIAATGLFQTASVDIAFRADQAETHKDSTSLLDITHAHSISSYSPKVGIALSRQGKLSYSLHANYGKSFRLPPLNALFWQGDTYTRGNPGLRPERSEHAEVGGEVNLTRGPISARISSTYFHRYVNDLIVWAQGQGGAWQPYNLAAALLYGHEDAMSLSLWRRAIVLQYTNTIVSSHNRVPGHVTYDKELTFTPHYVQNVAVKFDVDYLFGGCSVRNVGRRYALENNQKYYDAYSVIDVDLGTRVNVGRLWRLEITSGVNNLFDRDYVLIAHYPMPGREWRLGVKIEFRPGR